MDFYHNATYHAILVLLSPSTLLLESCVHYPQPQYDYYLTSELWIITFKTHLIAFINVFSLRAHPGPQSFQRWDGCSATIFIKGRQLRPLSKHLDSLIRITVLKLPTQPATLLARLTVKYKPVKQNSKCGCCSIKQQIDNK